MIFIRLFSADTPETSTVPGCEQITVLQLRNVESRAAVLKWLLTAGCKRWRRNEWRIFIINILLLWLQARILVFSGERILSPSPSLSPALLSSSSLSLPNLFLFKFTLIDSEYRPVGLQRNTHRTSCSLIIICHTTTRRWV